MATAAIAAGITAVGGLAATAASNASNKAIASDANAFNEKMLDKQLQYNQEMYERQLQDNLKYSDPSYIRDRLQMAGYNPALVGTGNVGTAVSSPQAQGINPPRAQTYQADYSGMGTAVSNAMQVYNSTKSTSAEVDNKNAETQGVIIDNATRAQRNFAALIETLRRVKGMKFENRIKQAVSNQIDVQLALQRSFMSAQEREVRERTNEQIMKNAMTSIDLKNYPEVVRLQIGTSAQQLYNMKLQGKLTDEQIKKTAAEIVTENERAFNLTADTMNKQRQGSILASQDQSARIQAQYDADTYKARVDMVTVELRRLIRNSGSSNLFNLGDAALQDLSRLTGLKW